MSVPWFISVPWYCHLIRSLLFFLFTPRWENSRKTFSKRMTIKTVYVVCDENQSGLIRWGLHVKNLPKKNKKKFNYELSISWRVSHGGDTMPCHRKPVWLFQDSEWCRCHLCFPEAGFICSIPLCSVCVRLLLFSVADLCLSSESRMFTCYLKHVD